MSEPLQRFDREESAYERVEQRWRCGRTGPEGRCRRGPNGRGRCRGVEEEGEGECRPVRTLRGTRDYISRLAGMATLGILIYVWFGVGGDDFISPGPLSLGHATLSCQDCHGGAAGGIIAMPHVEFGERGCLGCHPFEHKSTASLVHSLSGEVLDEARERAMKRMGMEPLSLTFARWLSSPPGPGELMKCSVCHVEHRGDFDAPHLEDATCQVCHVEPFRSFKDGHPEFRDVPTTAKRRSPIAFDHSTHVGLMFPERGMKLECSHCHWPAEDGIRIEIAGYDHGCAECHSKDLDPEALGPFVLFELPEVDPLHFPSEGWPEARQDNRPGKFSPAAAQQLLLGRVKGVVEAGARFDKRLAKSSKEEGGRVVAELAAVLEDGGGAEPDKALRERISAAVPLAEGEFDLDGLGGEELLAALSRAGDVWFRGVEEVEAPPASAFFVDSEEFTIGYRPSGHADPILKAWMPLMARAYRSGGFRGAFSDRWFAACTKCHNADAEGEASMEIGWMVNERLPLEQRNLTRFVHGPHLAAFPDWANKEGMWPSGNCQTCHPTLADVGEREGFFGFSKGVCTDPFSAVKEFAPITKEGCATCHGSGEAEASCLTCHSYHAH